ncbi:fungalysin/thermolysin propeptide [Melghirimyces profundicolus]|uniref:Fungalysin/thermolysin propeptide n=1 Tax=Melghirimyces profundicolus TaxID=1242148 RepID=A0A2T6BXJ0_9BACL|nr:M36 family metallopeptidase [Melghirimyces profundicolus]PTX60802.1 fungalysin/thermolysin propeptide [Melghirimyces profundicolus]
MKRWIPSLSVLLAVAMLALAFGERPAVRAFQSIEPSGAEAAEGELDVRKKQERIQPTDKIKNALKDLSLEAGSGLRVTWNPAFGTPSFLFKSKGYLSKPKSGSAEEVARGWLSAHRELFGWSEAEVDKLQLVRDYALPGTGLHPVTFQQTFDGTAAAAGGRVIVAVAEDGKVLSVSASAQPSASLEGSFQLSAADALDKVASSLAPQVDFTPGESKEEKGWHVFPGGNFPAGQRVKKAVFPMGKTVRPAWRILFIGKLNEGYEVLVDAETGKFLFKRSLVNHSGPEGSVFENFPGAPAGGTQVIKSFQGDPDASPKGWVSPVEGVDGPTTAGNNADSYANWSNFLVPEGTGIVRPVNPLSHFHYGFADAWHRTQCEDTPPSYAEDVNSATTNLFYHHNLFHDHLYHLGWTEPAGNLQVDNFGKGGLGGDPILGLAQAGALTGGEPTYTGRDNAYMLTLPDGIASWSGMFLWEPIPGAFEGKCVDGDYDAGIIYHEYSHALSNRLVAGGESLNSFQSGSMGEGWGDWLGVSYLMSRGLQETSVVGEYVTGNAESGIRNWSLADNPLGFGDLGYDITGPEVHADGEIWSAILWKIREVLAAKYGEEKGARVAEQLIVDAMPISAPNPSMIDMRDAILAADVDRHHGDHFHELWKVFASRGLGAGAAADSADDTDPRPAFDHLDSNQNGQLVGKVINASTGKPVEGARVIVGSYEARTSHAAKTGTRGGFGIDMTEGTYDITIQARGFGSRTLKDIPITKGKTQSLKVKLSPNYASLANGAKVMSVTSEDAALKAKNAFDDTEATVWATQEKESGFDGEHVVLKLAGDEPVTVKTIQVSAFKDISKARFAALKDFTLQVSEDGIVWKTVQQGTFKASKPRPTAPELHYLTWELKQPVKATHIRFFADHAQDDSLGYAQTAEIQVFGDGRQPEVEPAPLPDEDPVVEEGTVEAGNPTSDTAGGVTQNDFAASCNPNPATEGLDGWVMEVPESFGDGTHTVSATGPGEGTYDFDLAFYSADCRLLGTKASSAADESGVMPGGTWYVVANLWLGAHVPVKMTARPAE